MNTEPRELQSGNYEGTEANTNSNDLTKVLIGALAGAAVGSLIGGSFTQKGIELRNRVGESSKNIASNLKEKVSDMTDALADKYENAKETASDLIEKGKQKVGMSSGDADYNRNTAYGNTGYKSNTEDDESGTGSKILLGALLVSVAGTLVWGFTSEKGSETRKRLARSSKDIASNLKEKVTDVAGNIADQISDTYVAAKEGASDLLQKELQKAKTPPESTSFNSPNGAANF